MRRIAAGARAERGLIAILVVAFSLRLAALAFLEYVPVFDAVDYQIHAAALVASGGYPADPLIFASDGPTAFRLPAYPYLLSAVYWVSGSSDAAARVLQALLGTLTVALTAVVGRRLFGRRSGLASALVAALYLPFVMLESTLLTEPLFLALELAALAAVLAHRAGPRTIRWAVTAGVLAGLAVLTRTNGLLLLPALVLLAGRPRPGPLVHRFVPSLALVLATLLVASPWVLRNAAVMGEPLLSSQSGYTLHGVFNEVSHRERARVGMWIPTTSVPRFAPLYQGNEIQIDRRLRTEAVTYLLDNPAYALEAGARNAARMLELTGFAWGRQSARGIGLSERLGPPASASFWLLALLAAAGLPRALRLAPPALWLIPALMLLVAFSGSDVRYRLPIDPFLVLAAGVALAAGWDRVRPRAQAV